jgi:hypothetical protein
MEEREEGWMDARMHEINRLKLYYAVVWDEG